VNIQGEFRGIKWIGFDRQRPGRRRELILKYSLVPGQWKPVTAPREVTSEPKFRKWASDELEQIAELGEKPTKQRGGATVDELQEKWLELKRADKSVSGATWTDDRSNLRSQIVPVWGSTPMLLLEQRLHDLRAWVRELAAKLSPTRVRNIVSTFRKFVRDAQLEGWVRLRSNPLDSPEVKTVLPDGGAKGTIVQLPLEVAQGLLDSPTKEIRRLVRYAVALNTGAGDGELAGCRCSDVLELEGDHPRLQITKAFKLRAKEEGLSAELGPPKNDYRVRAIPLNECAREALKLWLSDGWELWVGRPWSDHDPLFPSEQGSFSRPDFAAYLRQDLEAAGLPTADVEGRSYDFRSLRRTFSTMLSKVGVERELREQLMGQSSESVNTEHYTAQVPEKLFEAVRKLELKWTHRGGVLVALLGGAPSKTGASFEIRTRDLRFTNANGETAPAADSGKHAPASHPGAGPADGNGAIEGSATKDLVAEEFAAAVAEHGARAAAADEFARPLVKVKRTRRRKARDSQGGKAGAK
jgi:integrase